MKKNSKEDEILDGWKLFLDDDDDPEFSFPPYKDDHKDQCEFIALLILNSNSKRPLDCKAFLRWCFINHFGEIPLKDICSPNEVWLECGIPDRTCGSVNQGRGDCLESGCYCEKGYVRYDEKCIKLNDCPSTTFPSLQPEASPPVIATQYKMISFELLLDAELTTFDVVSFRQQVSNITNAHVIINKVSAASVIVVFSLWVANESEKSNAMKKLWAECDQISNATCSTLRVITEVEESKKSSLLIPIICCSVSLVVFIIIVFAIFVTFRYIKTRNLKVFQGVPVQENGEQQQQQSPDVGFQEENIV